METGGAQHHGEDCTNEEASCRRLLIGPLCLVSADVPAPESHLAAVAAAPVRAGGPSGSEDTGSGWTVRLRGHRQRVDRPAQRTQAAGGPSGSEDTGSGWTVRLRGHRQRLDRPAQRTQAAGGPSGSEDTGSGWTVRLRGHRQRVDRPAQRTQAAGGPSGSEDTGSGDRTRAIMAETKPKTSPKAIKFLFGGLAGMGATVFVQPLDLVKNRMQLSGQGTKAREYKTSFHALFSILKNEGVGGIYTGYLPLHHVPIII
ncbi:Mitochondrial 2-oxoglutarate/malate carrier protein [Collichthys lucidus]|uniref:Citrate transport protein n=1 Tax=Collichthys lucidus TaxID=240159 RepID=A0A4U5UW39_COLLU|nr:Mitochondrial 2-oxoglutarate/malate carrier protein [Collichthys lucidus]